MTTEYFNFQVMIRNNQLQFDSMGSGSKMRVTMEDKLDVIISIMIEHRKQGISIHHYDKAFVPRN